VVGLRGERGGGGGGKGIIWYLAFVIRACVH